jgi:Glycosyl transferase family 2
MELTILMPCLNEAETVATCVTKARAFLERAGVLGEVVVADNGSSDGSIDLARRAGARVVHVSERGYGAALIAGIKNASGKYVVMGDADDSYDFSALDNFLAQLRTGAQLVMGNRFKGGIKKGAMPFLHRYLGNPVLSFLGRVFFRSPIRDFHCGLRGFDRDQVLALELKTPGMEFASEMIVRATLANLRIAEVPTTLQPDGRSRAPHLRTWRDGWRHLRFLMLYSPRWLFGIPGLVLLGLGSLGQLALFAGPVIIGRVGFDIHTLLLACAASAMGVQMLLFGLLARVLGQAMGVLPPKKSLEALLRYSTLEIGLVIGGLLALTGAAVSVGVTFGWIDRGFGALDPRVTMRILIPAVTMMIVGVEILMASLFLSVIKLK